MFKIIGINYLTYQLKYHIYSNEVMFSLRALCKQGLIAHCTRILSGLLIIIDNCAIDLSVYLSVWQPDHPIRGTTLETPNVCVGSKFRRMAIFSSGRGSFDCVLLLFQNRFFSCPLSVRA